MPRHDFACPSCPRKRLDVYVPVTLGASQALIVCPDCQTRMAWIPAAPAMDFGPSSGAGFKAFTIEEEVRGRTERIEVDSLHKLRQVERESEQRARNGEGRPLVWRDYQQNRSNGDVHTLHRGNLADPHNVHPQVKAATAAKKATPRRGEVVTQTHGTL